MQKRNLNRVKSAVFESTASNLPVQAESENIAKFLPDDLYKSVALIIGLDPDIKEKLARAKRKDFRKLYKGVRYLSRAIQSITAEKDPSEEYDSESPIVEPPSPRFGVRSPASNPYYDFLQKTEREQVRWKSEYLPPETEQEKGLVKRADDITNQICADFCNYMHEMGGYDSPLFKQETVKELFQIEFHTHAAKSLKIAPRKLPSLPAEFANFQNIPEISYNNTLKRNIKSDIKAETKLPILMAFNRQLPKDKQWRPPTNSTKHYWKPKSYPKPVVSMENIWDGLTNLKSVHDYCKWIENHPRAKKPNFLLKSGLFEEKKFGQINHKYDNVNQLPKIDAKTLLAGERKSIMSPLPEDLKIKIED